MTCLVVANDFLTNRYPIIVCPRYVMKGVEFLHIRFECSVERKKKEKEKERNNH